MKMKKLVLASAIAVAAVSGAATAAEVFKKDALTLSVTGELEIQVGQAIGDDEDIEVFYDELELGFGAEYVINNNVTAFGNVVLNFNEQAENGNSDDTLDQAYVGLKTGNFSTSIGRQYFGSDDFGIEKSYSLDGLDAFGPELGSETIKVEYAAGNYTAVLSHDVEEEDGEVTDLFATAKVGRFDLGAAYQTAETVDAYGLSAATNVGKYNVGVDFSKLDVAGFDTSLTNLAVGFPVAAKTEAAVGAIYADLEGSNDVTQWYVNATHKLNSNVSVFGELNDNDIDNSDLGFLTGMKVLF
jgi:predicted porin